MMYSTTILATITTTISIMLKFNVDGNANVTCEQTFIPKSGITQQKF